MGETRKIAAILVADIVGYSRLTGTDEDRIHARLRTLRSDLIDPILAVHHGRVVKRTGDGAIVEFRSVVDAVRCGIEVQSGLAERNPGLPPEKRIEFRVGIHVGDVVEESDGDRMGDGVNIAARLEGIAKPEVACLSEDTYRQVKEWLVLAANDPLAPNHLIRGAFRAPWSAIATCRRQKCGDGDKEKFDREEHAQRFDLIRPHRPDACSSHRRTRPRACSARTETCASSCLLILGDAIKIRAVRESGCTSARRRAHASRVQLFALRLGYAPCERARQRAIMGPSARDNSIVTALRAHRARAQVLCGNESNVLSRLHLRCAEIRAHRRRLRGTR